MRPEHLNRFPNNPETAQSDAAKKLVSLLKKPLDDGYPVLLLLSGGSWISALEKADFSALVSPQNLKKLTITTLDERVETGPNNNFTKTTAVPFIDSLIKSGAQTISTIPQEEESVDDFGERINASLKEYFDQNPMATVIATAGVGGENNVPGHIAGIEPMPEKPKVFSQLFQNKDILYCGYLAEKLTPESRATATFTLLNKVDDFVLLILGPAEKRVSLDQILSDDPSSLSESPCTFFRDRSDTIIYTDIPE